MTLFLSGANISDGEYWTLSFGRQRSGNPAINSSVSSSYFLRAATQINGQVEQLFQTSSFYQESFDNNDVQGNVSELNTSGSFLVIGSQSIDNTQNLFLNIQVSRVMLDSSDSGQKQLARMSLESMPEIPDQSEPLHPLPALTLLIL